MSGVLGEVVRFMGVEYGLPQLVESIGDIAPGESAMGDRLPKDPMLVILLAVKVWLV